MKKVPEKGRKGKAPRAPSGKMAESRRNKYSYDRNYYETIRKAPTEGSAARSLDIEEIEEDFSEDPEVSYEEYTEKDFETTSPRKKKREYRPVEHTAPRTKQQTKVKVKVKYNFGFVSIMMILISLVALTVACYRYIEARADITQANKKIAAAKNELQDIKNINMSLTSRLDVEADRNYIYTVAVSKLNMVYPKENNTIYYEKPVQGYVRQYQEIPAVK